MMACPQREDGHLDVANDIAEAFARQVISPDEWRVLWVILRKTYGWNKPSDRIALSQFALATGMDKPHTCRAIKKLIARNIIAQTGNDFGMIYALQKDFSVWKSLPKQAIPLPKQAIIVAQTGNASLPEQATTNTTTTNTIIQESIAQTGNGKRPKKARTLQPPLDMSKLVIPMCLGLTDGFAELWAEWVEYRESKGLPLTQRAAEIQMRRLGLWGGDAACEAIERAITSGKWTDLYKPKDKEFQLPAVEE